MARASVLFAAVAALGLVSAAGFAAPDTAYNPDDEATATQPRYAVMNAPSDAPAAVNPAPPVPSPATGAPPPASAAQQPPVAAPTGAVTTAPAPPVAQSLSPPPPLRDDEATAAQPRYAAMTPPPAIASPAETVVVQGLRASQDSDYRLGPGDKLRLTVYNEPDLSGDFEVDGQGFVRLPLIGQMRAGGLSTFELETEVAGALAKGYLVNPRVAVEVTTYRPFYIIGEVSKPGEYAYVAHMTALNAIALAGGYTDRADDSDLYVRHQGEAEEHEYPADATTPIRPGDVVRVAKTPYWGLMTLLSPLISPFSAAAYLLK